MRVLGVDSSIAGFVGSDPEKDLARIRIPAIFVEWPAGHPMPRPLTPLAPVAIAAALAASVHSAHAAVHRRTAANYRTTMIAPRRVPFCTRRIAIIGLLEILSPEHIIVSAAAIAVRRRTHRPAIDPRQVPRNGIRVPSRTSIPVDTAERLPVQ